jgi:hypothetical protein
MAASLAVETRRATTSQDIPKYLDQLEVRFKADRCGRTGIRISAQCRAVPWFVKVVEKDHQIHQVVCA